LTNDKNITLGTFLLSAFILWTVSTIGIITIDSINIDISGKFTELNSNPYGVFSVGMSGKTDKQKIAQKV
jgi:hypothetical protein